MPKDKEPDTEELLARARKGDQRAGVDAIARQRERLKTMRALRMDKRLKARLDPSELAGRLIDVAADPRAGLVRDEVRAGGVNGLGRSVEIYLELKRMVLFSR